MSEKHTTRRRYITGKLIQRPADLMSAFLDSSTTPFCAVDNRGEFVVFNKACELLTGYSYEEMAGRSFFSLFEPSRHKELAETWATRGQRPDSSGEIDLPWVGKDGSVHTVRWFFTRLADTLGNAEFYAGIGQDDAHRALSTAVNTISLSVHAPVRADRWMLYRHRSTFAGDGMTHSECRVHDEAGALLASFTNDCMVRSAVVATADATRGL